MGKDERVETRRVIYKDDVAGSSGRSNDGHDMWARKSDKHGTNLHVSER